MNRSYGRCCISLCSFLRVSLHSRVQCCETRQLPGMSRDGARGATIKDWLRSLTLHRWVQRGYGGSLLPIRVTDLWTRAYLNSALRCYPRTAVKELVHYSWNGYFRASLQPRSVAIRKTRRGDSIYAWASSRCRMAAKCCGHAGLDRSRLTAEVLTHSVSTPENRYFGQSNSDRPGRISDLRFRGNTAKSFNGSINTRRQGRINR